ncbi:MAG TPA: ADP-ribosylglycohydrolase family protein [Capsulimonadaceae bacterium]|jgi:ADP-ribosylglycohydrolase
MIGSVIGDIAGSLYEGSSIKTKSFPFFNEFGRFTDDTVLSVAVAAALLESSEYIDRAQHYVSMFHDWFALYPDAGFGDTFFSWADMRDRQPYNSWGNGSAMRVGAIGWAFDTLDETLAEAHLSASVTHNHPEGIRGAQAVAAAIYAARNGADKGAIRTLVESRFSYDLSASVDEIRPTYGFDVSCQGSVPQSIICFLDSSSFEDAVRNAISLGGDSDTMACIAGSIAEAAYGVPSEFREKAMGYLDSRLGAEIEEFEATYGPD